MLRQHFSCFVQSGRSRNSRLFPEYRASATLPPPPLPPTFQMSLDEEREQTLANEARHWSHSNEPRPLLLRLSAEICLFCPNERSNYPRRKPSVSKPNFCLSSSSAAAAVRLSRCVSLFVSSPSVPPSVSLFGGRAYWRPGGEES